MFTTSCFVSTFPGFTTIQAPSRSGTKPSSEGLLGIVGKIYVVSTVHKGSDFSGHGPTVVDVFCLRVEVYCCRSLFRVSLNLPTSDPRRGFLCAYPQRRRVWGSNPPGNCGLGGSGLPHVNFSYFHQLLPPQKAKIQSYLAWPPTQVASFWAPKYQNEEPWHWSSVLNVVPKCHPVVSHQNPTSTHFSTPYEMMSCSTHLRTARTLFTASDVNAVCRLHFFVKLLGTHSTHIHCSRLQ